MQIIKKNARNLTERFIGSSFGQKCVMAAIALIISTSNVMAGSKGAAGFTKATQEVSSYQTPVSNLMKAIAAVIVLVGAFNVYFKMQNGDLHNNHHPKTTYRKVPSSVPILHKPYL